MYSLLRQQLRDSLSTAANIAIFASTERTSESLDHFPMTEAADRYDQPLGD